MLNPYPEDLKQIVKERVKKEDNQWSYNGQQDGKGWQRIEQLNHFVDKPALTEHGYEKKEQGK